MNITKDDIQNTLGIPRRMNEGLKPNKLQTKKHDREEDNSTIHTKDKSNSELQDIKGLDPGTDYTKFYKIELEYAWRWHPVVLPYLQKSFCSELPIWSIPCMLCQFF